MGGLHKRLSSCFLLHSVLDLTPPPSIVTVIISLSSLEFSMTKKEKGKSNPIWQHVLVFSLSLVPPQSGSSPVDPMACPLPSSIPFLLSFIAPDDRKKGRKQTHI